MAAAAEDLLRAEIVAETVTLLALAKALVLADIDRQGDGVLAVDARVKVAPYRPQDPFLRRLR